MQSPYPLPEAPSGGLPALDELQLQQAWPAQLNCSPAIRQEVAELVPQAAACALPQARPSLSLSG